MEYADIKSRRNTAITVLFLALAVGFFCAFFFLPFKVPAIAVLALACGVGYVLHLFGLDKFFLPSHRRKELTPIVGWLAGAGWFTPIGAGYLHQGKWVTGIILVAAGMGSALRAAWGISGLLRVKREAWPDRNT